ncbi:Rrf2 family transcriptional regulator [Companilactobacillus huachuanensis]|uniref:Rrf2 family transcriptional regulator n=1 Tax=Companilactobacillus huachuanensis TaxID=2559914 RepID=A0ABW1RP21_9LACO|nr:Rrf2 family transcriptional regulator [Companilactobacillus huachuanensis]
MKISKSIEQGIYVLLMMALQTDHRPLKSQLLSERLEVSDSYLKKILRKLVVAELIESNAGKEGGFTLLKPIDSISLYDVCQAIEDIDDLQLPNLHLARKLFPGDNVHIQESEQQTLKTFSQANDAFSGVLKTMTLDQLLESDSFQNGVVDWYDNLPH